MTQLKDAKNHVYDVVILGAGSAGLSAQAEVSKRTQNYVVIADEPWGTTCARVGCMPSKVLVEAANIYHQSYKFDDIGIMGTESLHVNDKKLMEHVRQLRDRFVNGVLKDMESWQQTHLFSGRAKILSRDRLQVGDIEIKSKKTIIATGSSPIIPEKWRHLSEKIFTSDTFFSLEKIPRRLAVIGTGPVGLELAQALARLDVELFLFGDADTIGGITDPEIVSVVIEQIKKELFFIPKKVQDIEACDVGFKVITTDSTHCVDAVLLAMGRSPNIQDLGLESLDIPLDKKGLPKTNPKSTRIKGTDFYLVGDVSGHIPLLHEAVDEGRIAGYNSVRDSDEEFERRTRLAITYSSPQIAVVGKSLKDLNEEGASFEVGSVSFEKQGRALAKLENAGMLKVFGDPETGRILGAEVFAPAGEHLAHLLAWSIDSKGHVVDLLGKPYYHPVIEEGLRTALRNLAKKLPKQCSDFDLSRCQDVPVGTYL